MDKNLELFRNYLKYIRNYSDYTILNYSKDIQEFLTYIFKEGFLFDEVDKNLIRNYLNFCLYEKKLSRRSVKRRISSLKHFYKFLIEEKIIEKDPFLTIKTLKNEVKYPEALYKSQCEKLIELTNERTDILKSRDLAIIELIIASGMRNSEIVNLKTIDIDFTEKFIRVFGKGKKERLVPFKYSNNVSKSEEVFSITSSILLILLLRNKSISKFAVFDEDLLLESLFKL